MTPEMLADIAAREEQTRQRHKHHIRVCFGSTCVMGGSPQIKAALHSELSRHADVPDSVGKGCDVNAVGCMGLCGAGPLVAAAGPAGEWLYQRVQPGDSHAIVASLERGEPDHHLLCPTDTPFFQQQHKIVLENAGLIDPERIEAYIAAEGYRALFNALTMMTPLEVIDEIVRSTLRGRGGAGYPAGLKWMAVAKGEAQQKYVICNGNEGSPGAFVDRTILESDPHRVLEGMAIAGYAVGASHGYIYICHTSDLAITRMQHAIAQAERAGILGNKIFHTTFSFYIELRVGAGAFVCGEETALMQAIEGKRAQPRPRAPYPAESGLWGNPTLVNNVETLANVAPIIRRGGAWYAAIGTETSKGTKVLTLSGPLKHSGVIEIPMGTILRDIVFQLGGGMQAGHHLKAVQVGGPAGGCVPQKQLDMPFDYETLEQAGAMLGSGGLVVLDDGMSMVELARQFMEFSMNESCGKCIPCRVGTAQIYDLLCNITEGQATMDDLSLLIELCAVVKKASLCGLGRTAPNPVLSTIEFFWDEYLEHIGA